MSALDLIARLKAAVVNISRRGGDLLAEPRAAVTQPLLALMRTHKTELLAALPDAQAISQGAERTLEPGAQAPEVSTDNRINCVQCANLIGRQCARWSELKASKGWAPVQLPLRCEQFKPTPGDPDQRTAAQRWPNLNTMPTIH